MSEELTRLRSHCQQFEAAARASGDEPVGRRLEFLLQEMGREVNTLGSKVDDLELDRRVLSSSRPSSSGCASRCRTCCEPLRLPPDAHSTPAALER